MARITDIICTAAMATRIPLSDICGPDRSRRFVEVRAAITMIAREHNHSYPQIAAHFGRDHSSLVHYVNSWDVFCVRSPWLVHLLDNLREQCRDLPVFAAEQSYRQAKQAGLMAVAA